MKTAHFRRKSRDMKLGFQISIEYFSLNWKGHIKIPGCFRKPWASALTWMCWKNVLAQKLLLQRHLSKKRVVPLTFFEKSFFLEQGQLLHDHWSKPISETSQMAVWSRPSFWCKTLGVQKVQSWLLEAAKVVKKCQLRNPENNQGCQLFQTLAQFSSYRLFLAIPGQQTSPAFLGLSGYIWSLGKNEFDWNSWQDFLKFS